MRFGHGPGGATRIAINEKQLRDLVFSSATCGELVQNLMKMTNEKDGIQLSKRK